MSTELIAIIGVGVALAGLILNGQSSQRAEIMDLQGGLEELREDTQAEFKSMREETQSEFKSMREETQSEFKSMREETQSEFKVVRSEISGLRERMARLQGLLEGLREAVTGRGAAVAESMAGEPGPP